VVLRPTFLVLENELIRDSHWDGSLLREEPNNPFKLELLEKHTRLVICSIVSANPLVVALSSWEEQPHTAGWDNPRPTRKQIHPQFVPLIEFRESLPIPEPTENAWAVRVFCELPKMVLQQVFPVIGC
jgi:hypothetical protein